MRDALVATANLKKYFPVKSRILKRIVAWVKAVDGVSFEIREGESFGLVGESGSGKTTTGKLLAKLLEPTGGSIFFEGREISKVKGKAARKLRKEIRFVFQDPYAALNPRIKVIDVVAEPILVHNLASTKVEARSMASEILANVGMEAELFDRYPHELSGGQRQRVLIARALASSPRFLILDEPTSMLDVSVQAQILNLLRDLRGKYGLTYLFITHNLAVVRYMCETIAIMYLGKIVECGPREEIFERPRHPYTVALRSAYPPPDPERLWEPFEIGDVPPDPVNLPPGCRFHPRCPFAASVCRELEPKPVRDGRVTVSCHIYNERYGRYFGGVSLA